MVRYLVLLLFTIVAVLVVWTALTREPPPPPPPLPALGTPGPLADPPIAHRERANRFLVIHGFPGIPDTATSVHVYAWEDELTCVFSAFNLTERDLRAFMQELDLETSPLPTSAFDAFPNPPAEFAPWFRPERIDRGYYAHIRRGTGDVGVYVDTLRRRVYYHGIWH